MIRVSAVVVLALAIGLACSGGATPAVTADPAPVPITSRPAPVVQQGASTPGSPDLAAPPELKAEVHLLDVPPWEAETVAGCCGYPLRDLEVSSTLPAQGASSYGADHLGDDLATTPWVEGVDGGGEGEWLEFTWIAEGDMDCSNLLIRNGYQKSNSSFTNNARVRTLEVAVDGAPVGTVQLQDSMDEHWIKPPAKAGQRVRLTIRGVYPGKKWEDTALSEVVQLCAP